MLINEENLLTVPGEKTLLRTFTLDDISSEYINWLRDFEIMRYSNQRFRVHTKASCQSYVESFYNSSNLFLGIWLRDSRRLVGTVTAYRSIHHQTADMGIMIGDRDSWGKGVGLDAWCSLMNYLFKYCDLRKVTAGTLRCNVRMIRLIERSGMNLEGIRQEQELVERVPQDALYYAKFRPT